MRRRKAGDPCPYCERPLHEEFIAEKKKRLSEDLKAVFTERKERGLHNGRPITIDRIKVMGLRMQGLSCRAIARELGCSHGHVASLLKWLK